MSIHLSSISKEHVAIAISPPISSRRTKYEIEESLAPVITQIQAEKRKQLSGKKIIQLTMGMFLMEAREKPLHTAVKTALVFVAIAALYPACVGFIACMNGYRLKNWNDLYSTDLNVATQASQLFSNLGQGISFLIEGAKTLIFTSYLLGRNSYDSARNQIILDIYNELTPKIVSKEEKKFINEMKKREFIGNNNLFSIEPKNGENNKLIEIKNQIEAEKKTRFKAMNIVLLTTYEFMQETKKSPWTTVGKLSFLGLAIAALHPFILGTIACLESYRVDSPDHLFSSDPNIANNATQTFSNTGHIEEYLIEGICMVSLSSKLLLQTCYKRALHKIVNDLFNKHIKDPSLTKKESDLLYKMKQKELKLA